MATKIEIGTKIIGKLGAGLITKIITKSTGYVEVTYNNGSLKKEMATNLKSENGEVLKNKPLEKEANIVLNLDNLKEYKNLIIWSIKKSLFYNNDENLKLVMAEMLNDVNNGVLKCKTSKSIKSTLINLATSKSLNLCHEILEKNYGVLNLNATSNQEYSNFQQFSLKIKMGNF